MDASSVRLAGVADDSIKAGKDFVALSTREVLNSMASLSGTSGHAVELLGGQQHEPSLAAFGYVDGATTGRLNHLTRSVAKLRQW